MQELAAGRRLAHGGLCSLRSRVRCRGLPGDSNDSNTLQAASGSVKKCKFPGFPFHAQGDANLEIPRGIPGKPLAVDAGVLMLSESWRRDVFLGPNRLSEPIVLAIRLSHRWRPVGRRSLIGIGVLLLTLAGVLYLGWPREPLDGAARLWDEREIVKEPGWPQLRGPTYNAAATETKLADAWPDSGPQ
jgi:hypothetical protein